MSKNKKYNCEKCQDTGYWSNPFDQEFKCDCKKKKYKRPDYRGFVLHIWEWHRKGFSWSIYDLTELAKIYKTPIPKNIKKLLK